jgi:hypothetical protein
MSRCLLNFAAFLSFASLAILGGSFNSNAQAQSLIALRADDPRVPQSFSELGEMVQAGNVVWGGVFLDHKLTQVEALHFCHISAGRLPKREDFEDLQNYRHLGSVPSERSSASPGADLMIWTAHETHYFSVDQGRFFQAHPGTYLGVRCIFDLPAPQDAAATPAVSELSSESGSPLLNEDQIARILLSLRDARSTPPLKSAYERIWPELAESENSDQVNDLIWSSHVQTIRELQKPQ